MHRAGGEVKEEESGGKRSGRFGGFVTTAVDTTGSQSENLSGEMELSEREADNFSGVAIWSAERRGGWDLMSLEGE